MGDFNVSCGASGVSMGTDRAVLIPLTPTRFGIGEQETGKFSMPGCMIVTNEGIHSLFDALTLPLFGNLDSYGRLENIEQDANVECIEKFFNMHIGEFMEELTRSWVDRSRNKQMAALNVSGMFVHRDIYDMMTSDYVDDFGKPGFSIWDDGLVTSYVLTLMGFEFIEEDEKKERYDQLFIHPDFPEVKVWSDGRWNRLLINDKEYTAYTAGKTVAIIEEHSGQSFSDEMKERLQSLSRQTSQFDEAFFEREKIRVEGDSLLAKWAMKSMRHPFSLGDYMDEAAKERFEAIYGDRLIELRQPYIDYKQFEMGLGAVNRLLMPTWNGYQYGNHHASRILHQKALEIVEANIQEMAID